MCCSVTSRVAGEPSSTPSFCSRVRASLPRSSAIRLSTCFPSGNLVNVGSPTVDGRSRARHRRALIRDLVRTYIESSPPMVTDRLFTTLPRRPSGAVCDSSHREPLMKRAVPRLWLLLETSAAACETSSRVSFTASLHLWTPRHWNFRQVPPRGATTGAANQSEP